MRGEAGFYTRRMTFVGIAVRRMSKIRELQSMAGCSFGLGWDDPPPPLTFHTRHSSLSIPFRHVTKRRPPTEVSRLVHNLHQQCGSVGM